MHGLESVAIMKIIAKGAFQYVGVLQENFRRNDKEVDREVRDAIVMKMSDQEGRSGNVDLTIEQKQIFMDLEKLFKDEASFLKELKSSAHDVKMWINYHDKKMGRSLTLGKTTLAKAEGIVDCAAEEAAAWFFDFCSNERTKMSRERGDLARLEIARAEQTRANEKTIAVIEKSPFPLQDREYVSKLIWRVNSDGLSFSVAIWPAPDIVDYGDSIMTKKIVRGVLKGIFTATNVESIGNVRQCRVTYRQSVDAGGIMPNSVINSKLIPHHLMVVKEAIDYFKRDAEVDSAALSALAGVIKSKPQEYTADEKDMIKRGRDFFKIYSDEKKNHKVLTSSNSRFHVRAVDVSGRNFGAGVAVAVIDADIETCLAYEFIKDSREAASNRKSKGVVEASVKKVNEHCNLYLSIRNLRLPGLSHREWRMKTVWERCDDGTHFLAYEDTNELDDEFPVKPGNVVASSRAAYLYEPLPKIGNVPQTRVTFVGKVDVKGSTQNLLMNKLILGIGKNVLLLQKRFDRSDEIDAEIRSSICRDIRSKKSIIGGADYATNFIERIGKVKVKSAFPLTKSWVKVEGFGKGWGLMTTNVMASLEDAAAYFWDFESRAHADITGDTERSVMGRRGEFVKFVRRRQKVESKHGGIHRERTFLNEMTLHVVNANIIVITINPAEDYEGSAPVRKLGSGILKANVDHQATEQVAVRFTRRGENATKMEFVTELELGLFVSKKATRCCLERHLDEATSIQRYFAYKIKLEHMTEKVGEVLAHDMAWKGGQLAMQQSRSDRAKHVEDVMTKSKALNAVRTKYPWIVILMQRAREGALSTNHSVATKLSCIREEEARVIGNNLMPALKRNKLVGAGVDQWRVQNKAVDELLTEYPWMKGLFEVLGQR